MTKTYIVAAKRTAIGKFLGTTLSMTAADLGAAVIKNIIAETGVDPANIDEVIVGNVLSAGQGQGVARQASIKGGIPQEVPAYGINMICGSGRAQWCSRYQIGTGEPDHCRRNRIHVQCGLYPPGTCT